MGILRSLAGWLGVVGLALDLVGAVVIIMPDIEKPQSVLQATRTYQQYRETRDNLESGRDLLFQDRSHIDSVLGGDSIVKPSENGFDEILQILADEHDGGSGLPGDPEGIYHDSTNDVQVKIDSGNYWCVDPERVRTELDRRLDGNRREMTEQFLRWGVYVLIVGFGLQIAGELILLLL